MHDDYSCNWFWYDERQERIGQVSVNLGKVRDWLKPIELIEKYNKKQNVISWHFFQPVSLALSFLRKRGLAEEHGPVDFDIQLLSGAAQGRPTPITTLHADLDGSAGRAAGGSALRGCPLPQLPSGTWPLILARHLELWWSESLPANLNWVLWLLRCGLQGVRIWLCAFGHDLRVCAQVIASKKEQNRKCYKSTTVFHEVNYPNNWLR